ncbi:penicillin-binding transpeptidase domain-containing protein [Telluribacter sp. SYSU D00476]|uniref:penicillin-binding transpeptidase domain-containing protein n=1 Tax=Telluribacter sp. SYSU D00476 TaxID=2811430 RepID=UPI001FF1187C|nr:penicillin-binding transpeptidase domain-containing protein [Telluribacter sp. SYSU D00476]
MYSRLLAIILLLSTTVYGQIDLQKPFRECGMEGSTTIYDYKNRKWIYSNEADSQIPTLPASTFKIINSLIVLETGVVRDENEVVPWVGKTDTVLYGYRPDIYHDMTIKEAFEKSAGWVYVELAKKVGKDRYLDYLKRCGYGNQDLSGSEGADFWNFGNFAISPANQVSFLRDFYEEKLPFSKRTFEIVKQIMVSERTDNYTLRAKTGWTRYGGKDTGWWVGYVERKDNVYFFATRLIKPRSTPNRRFGTCRIEITKAILRQLQVLD